MLRTQASLFIPEQHGHVNLVGWYSVMQSVGNTICRDIVFDSFNKAYRDEDKILNQIYEKKTSYVLYHEDFHVMSD